MTLIGAPQLLSALIPLAKVQNEGKPVEEQKKEDEQRGEMDLEQWCVLFSSSLGPLHFHTSCE